MKIKFTKDAPYKQVNPDHGKPGRPAGETSYLTKWFKAGQVYDLPQDQADRWLRRGVAEPAGKAASVAEDPEPKSPPPPPPQK